MRGSNATLLPTGATEAPQWVEEALEATFRCRFDCWRFDDGWRPSGRPSDVEAPSEELSAVLDEARRAGEPRMFDSGGRPGLLAIPILLRGRLELVATGCPDQASPELAQNLASMWVRDLARLEELEQLRDENGALARQVTHDFEELTFLRETSGRLDMGDVTLDLARLVEAVLPRLERAIEAEALAFVSDPPGGSVWVGQRVIDESACRALVEIHAKSDSGGPVVNNHLERTDEGGRFPGVRGFVVVPVGEDGRRRGWLLAINRLIGPSYKSPAYCRTSHSEFGSVEVSLLASTASILATHASNVELFRQRERLLTEVVRSMVAAIEAKDAYTRGHSERVALFGQRLAREIGFDDRQCEDLYLSGVLHDIGKIGVSDATLNKPGRLTDEEYEEIKRHPDEGWNILHGIEQLSHMLPGVLYHHERFDGAGYPDGLVGKDIPIEGRILAIADAYDAMTSDRPYRDGMPQERVETILREGAGAHWDPDLVEAFFRAMPDIVSIKNGYRPQKNTPRNCRSSEEEAGDNP